MFLFGRRDRGPTYGALIDISSGSVGVGIVYSDPEKKLPELLYSHRALIRVTSAEYNHDETLRRMRETLLSAALILSQEGVAAMRAHKSNARVLKLYITCSSPWSYTVARSVHFEDTKTFRITKSMVGDLVESAETEIMNHLREHALVSKEGFTVVERATVDMMVNEYPLLNPIGTKGTVLSLSHIAGLMPAEIITAIRDIQQKLFPSTDMRAHTYMLVMYCVLRDLFPTMRSTCIIDVTGEATEFGIVENNLLIENNFIPYGSNSFIREVMKQTGKPATDICTSMAHAETDGFEDKDVDAHVEHYTKHIEDALEEILSRRLIPEHVVVTVQRPYEHLFKHAIESAMKRVTGGDAHIVTFDPKVVDEVAQGHSEDVYLSISARFFHKLHGCGDIGDL